MSKENTKDTINFANISYTVDASWLHNKCHEYARDDADFYDENDENIETHGDAIYENMSEETTRDVLVDAVRDIKHSCLESDNPSASDVIDFLYKMQEEIRQECMENSGFDVEVGYDVDYCHMLPDEDLFYVLCNGKIYSNFISKEEVKTIVYALVKGAHLCNRIDVETTAGRICAERVMSTEAPGIGLYLIPRGRSYEVDMAIAECKESEEIRMDGDSEDDVALYIYGRTDLDEWTERIDFKHNELLKNIDD